MNSIGLLGEKTVVRVAHSSFDLECARCEDTEGMREVQRAIYENTPILGRKFFTIEDAENEYQAALCGCESYQELCERARFMELATGDEMYADVMAEVASAESEETNAERLSRQGGFVDFSNYPKPY